MARFKIENGVQVPYTQAEEDARDAEELAWANRDLAAEADARKEAALNSLLLSDGSVFRALAEFVFRLSKGQIAIDPNRTPAQFRAILKSFL